jgi:hypothetical protein
MSWFVGVAALLGAVAPVTWKGEDALNHGGKPVILRFQLRQASLYGIEFY